VARGVGRRQKKRDLYRKYMIDQIYSLLGHLILDAGAAALLLFAAIKFLGGKYIETKFAIELERAKSEINLLSSRTLKLRDKEYEILPEVWSKLNDAHFALQRCLKLLRESTNLERMSDEDFQDFLKNSDLTGQEKKFIAQSSHKNRDYLHLLEWRDINNANKLFGEFHRYLENVRIFLDPELKQKFDKIDDYIWSAWTSNMIGKDDRDTKMKLEAYKILKEKIGPLMKEIENLLQSRLFPVTN
jgi:hypothetical protein